jgi:hypothetical protein
MSFLGKSAFSRLIAHNIRFGTNPLCVSYQLTCGGIAKKKRVLTLQKLVDLQLLSGLIPGNHFDM